MGAPAKPAAVSSIAAAGPVLSKSEARSIADAKGKTVAQVMANAQNKGVALGSGLVNQFNSGKAGPNLSNLNTSIGNTPIPIGVNNRTAQALTQLQALQGLRMNPGTAYAGYSTTTTPARDTSTVNGGGTYRSDDLERAHTAIEDTVATESVGELALKGFSAPVSVFAIARGDASDGTSPTVHPPR